MVRVTTAYYSSYQSVNRCVVCGNTAITGVLPVQGSNNSYKRIDTLTINFPLCSECDEALQFSNALIKPFRKWGWLSFLFFVVALILLVSFANQKSYFGALMTINLLLWFGGMITIAIMRSVAKQKNKEKWNHCKRVRRSVIIQSFTRPSMFAAGGRVVFRFEEDAYGREFAQLNMGKVL